MRTIRTLLEQLHSIVEDCDEDDFMVKHVRACQSKIEAATGVKIGKCHGCAGHGCVFDAGSGLVLKFTDDVKEARLSTFAKDMSHLSEHLQRIKGVWKFDKSCTDDHDFYIIVREDLDDVTFSNPKWWNAHMEKFDSLTKFGKSMPEKKRALSDMHRFSQGAKYAVFSGSEKVSPQDQKYFEQAYQLMKVLVDKHDVYLCDMHAKNWGLRGSTLVVRDIGCHATSVPGGNLPVIECDKACSHPEPKAPKPPKGGVK